MDNIKDLIGALSKAQAEIEGAVKAGENPHFRSRYADLGNVWAACRGPLTQNGLAIHQAVRVNGDLRLVTRVMHSSGQWLEDDGIPLLLDKQNMQGLGSALTYARRYGLMAAVGIAPEDDDGNAAVKNGGKEGKPVGGNGDLITAQQKDTIIKLLRETEVDMPRFLKYMDVASVDGISADKYGEAINALAKKKKKNGDGD
jgi:hypothetical protein